MKETKDTKGTKAISIIKCPRFTTTQKQIRSTIEIPSSPFSRQRNQYQLFINKYNLIDYNNLDKSEYLKIERDDIKSYDNTGDYINTFSTKLTEIKSREFKVKKSNANSDEEVTDSEYQTKQFIIRITDIEENDTYNISIKIIFATYGKSESGDTYKHSEIFTCSTYVGEDYLKYVSHRDMRLYLNPDENNNNTILKFCKHNIITLFENWVNNEQNHTDEWFELGKFAEFTYVMKLYNSCHLKWNLRCTVVNTELK